MMRNSAFAVVNDGTGLDRAFKKAILDVLSWVDDSDTRSLFILT